MASVTHGVMGRGLKGGSRESSGVSPLSPLPWPTSTAPRVATLLPAWSLFLTYIAQGSQEPHIFVGS